MQTFSRPVSQPSSSGSEITRRVHEKTTAPVAKVESQNSEGTGGTLPSQPIKPSDVLKGLEKLGKNKGTSNVEQHIKDNGIAVNNIANRPKQVEFLNSILHGAVSEYLRTGIPWQVTMAQAAQETGWGDKEIIDMYSGESSNNLFGIKYFGSKTNTSAYALTWTTEYIKSSDLGYWQSEQAKWAQAGEVLVL